MTTRSPCRIKYKPLQTAFVVITLLPSLGCIGATAQLLYMIRGIKVEAEYDGLKGKRVAVVCVSDASQLGPDRASEILSRHLEATLKKNVKKIELVPREGVLDWMDNNDWDQIDFTQVGRGVEAEMLVAVELSSYRLNNGRTLFQGRADVTVSVYNVGDENLVFRRAFPGFEYPKNGGQPVTDTTRAAFEQKFIYMLSQKIANLFYDYEMATDFGQDATLIGQ